MLILKRSIVVLLLTCIPLFFFSGCQAVAAYLITDLITGGPIFGGGGGNDPTPGNHAPQIVTIQALPDTIPIGGAVTLSVVATDEDSDTMTYLWEASKGHIADPTENVTIWTAPTDFTGLFQISVTVSDGKGGTDVDAVEVHVTL